MIRRWRIRRLERKAQHLLDTGIIGAIPWYRIEALRAKASSLQSVA